MSIALDYAAEDLSEYSYLYYKFGVNKVTGTNEVLNNIFYTIKLHALSYASIVTDDTMR